MKTKKKNFSFKVLRSEDLDGVAAYTGGCSGGRSDCCTRACTRIRRTATAEQWGKFLAVNAGVVQY